MSRLALTVFLGALAFFVFRTEVCAQATKTLKFTDDSEIGVTTGFFNGKVASIKFFEKEIVATLNSWGKAGMVSAELFNSVKKSEQKFVEKLKAANTAFDLAQGERTFSIRALNAPFEKLHDCNGCQVKSKLILLEIKSADGVLYIPVIKSIEKF